MCVAMVSGIFLVSLFGTVEKMERTVCCVYTVDCVLWTVYRVLW